MWTGYIIITFKGAALDKMKSYGPVATCAVSKL